MKAQMLALSAFVILAVAGASAEDMPVTYLVDRPTLIDNAIAGTVLTFELYVDSLCTTPIHTETIVVEDPDLLIEGVDLLRVQRGPRPPRAARLNLTLTNVLPGPIFFLEVTGTGISPIGRICQPQPLFFTVSETPIPTGVVVLQDETSCPSGFTLLTSYNGKFLAGSNTAGTLGGSNTHTHGAGSYAGPSHTHGAGSYTAPDHTHGAGGYTAAGHTHSFTTGTESNGLYLTANTGGPMDRICGGDGTCPVQRHPHTHSGTTDAAGGGSITGMSAPGAGGAISGTSAADGTGAVTGTSASADSRPEFKTILLCKKN